MRHRAVFAVVPLLVLLAGCSPSPAQTPTPESSTSPVESPAPADSAAADFTTAALVELCVEKVREQAADATYHLDRATTEWLEPVSSWFVVVPKDLDGQESAAVCGIHGNPENPEFEMFGETLMDGIDQARDDLLAVDDEHDH